MPIEFAGKGTPISAGEFQAAVTAVGGDAASLWAMVAVETRGFGFLSDRRPQMLFERHVFHRRTDGQYSQAYPTISNPRPGGYSGGAAEYGRLRQAMALDDRAALESASWGLGQVMGYNAGIAGFADVYDLVAATVGGEAAQLRAMVTFITANANLLEAVRDHAWSDVAFYYNGANYTRNCYDLRLEQRYALYSAPANCPDIAVREAQACLFYLGHLQGGVDGCVGPRTRLAVTAFRRSKGLPPGGLDSDLIDRLREDAGI